MLTHPIFIQAITSISALGSTSQCVWQAYQNPNPYHSLRTFGTKNYAVGQLDEDSELMLQGLQEERSVYNRLDKTVLMALCVSRLIGNSMNDKEKHSNFGINIGSSRGATQLFESFHQNFLESGECSPLVSPTTTLGNISTWVAQDLQSSGPVFSHSITCSTAMHALLNGIAWMQAGMADSFLVGGSEAALTAFTISQMEALRIYTTHEEDEYPSRALDLKKDKNTFYLGEGAATAYLSKIKTPNTKAKILGIGYATENIAHAASVSPDGDCFQKAMQMALKGQDKKNVDGIVLHAPGTVKGDVSEYVAVKKVFGETMPALTTNKWKIGHTFGASGLFSLELAILMLQNQQWIPVPYLNLSVPEKLERVMVNAMGFGGNAVSILVERV